MNNSLLATLFLFPFLIFALPDQAFAVSGTPTWFESRVGTVPGGSFVSSPSLAFDHYGTPSVSWSQVANGSGTNIVRHSQFTGLGLWNSRDVASGTDIALVTSLAFDRAERPTIAWINNSGNLSASFNGGAAQPFGVSAAVTTPALSISYDLAGNLRGAYAKTTPGNFFDISYSGGTFSTLDMTTISGVSSIIDAALIADGRGLRQVAARANLTGGGQAIMLASEPSVPGPWASGQLIAADNVFGVDIKMDPTDGRAALVYTTFDNTSQTSKLLYTKFNGFAPVTTEIFSSSSLRFEDVSLSFDLSDGQPAIAYERRNNMSGAQELHFAYRTPALSWQTSLVDAMVSLDAPGGRPRRPSLAFDDYGTSWPAIAYVDSDGGLNVAFDPPAPEPQAILLLALAAHFRPRRRITHVSQLGIRRRQLAAA